MIKSIVPIKPEVEVRVIECGPLRLGGHVRIVFPDGSMIIKQRAFICRCGKQKNQPFCDGYILNRFMEENRVYFIYN